MFNDWASGSRLVFACAMGWLATLAACETSKPTAQPDSPQALQRRLFSPDQCKRSEVSYCAAHGSRAKDGLCQCLRQQDARAVLDNIE